MNTNLERADLLQVGPITHRGTLKLLPVGKKGKQKLIIGDDSGLVGCYEFKKGEPQVVFQSQLYDGAITCVALGGNPKKRDKIFVSHSQRIVGITKKGGDFFKLTSSLTETIHNISVEDTRIWTGCEYIYNMYDNGKDAAFYMARDRINDLIVANVTRDSNFDAILACQDNCIRIIRDSALFLEIPTANPVVALAFVDMNTEVKATKQPTGLVYATENGCLALCQVLPSGEFVHCWSMDDGERRSPITCILMADVFQHRQWNNIIVGRDDGRVEVYKAIESYMQEPTKVFSKDIGESIRSIQCGLVNSSEYNEIIVAAYSGKIISFTNEPVHQRATEDQYGRSIQTINNENRMKALHKELEDLKKKVEVERAKVKKNIISTNANASLQSASKDFSINSKFIMVAELAAYVLTIELQNAVDLIILRSPVVLDLVETDTGTAVLSVTPPHLQHSAAGASSGAPALDGDPQNMFVAVIRCQSDEKRLALTLRTNEGEYGDLTVTVVAASTPKAAKIIKYSLKPLSLHIKVHSFTEEEEARPRNRIKFTGNVQIAVVHEWMQNIFPDVPARLDESETEQKYYFRNTFTGAVSMCEFRRNEIIVESECASTVAIAKENITRLANFRRTALEESLSTNAATISSFLELIREKLEYQLSLTRKIQLLDAVQEISMQETDKAWMSDEFSVMLRDQELIRKEFKQRDKSLEYLSGIITDLFVDWNRLQGLDVKHKIPQLQQVVLGGNFDLIAVNITGGAKKR